MSSVTDRAEILADLQEFLPALDTTVVDNIKLSQRGIVMETKRMLEEAYGCKVYVSGIDKLDQVGKDPETNLLAPYIIISYTSPRLMNYQRGYQEALDDDHQFNINIACFAGKVNWATSWAIAIFNQFQGHIYEDEFLNQMSAETLANFSTAENKIFDTNQPERYVAFTKLRVTFGTAYED